MTQNTTLADELEAILIDCKSRNESFASGRNLIEQTIAALRHSAGDAGAVEALFDDARTRLGLQNTMMDGDTHAVAIEAITAALASRPTEAPDVNTKLKGKSQ